MPYVYVFWAALSTPFVQWEDVLSLTGFIRLITRAVYGSFQANSGFGLHPVDRNFQILFFFETLYIDFTKLGILLSILGAIYLFFKHRILFWQIGVFFIFSGPLFAYYAAFPLSNDFFMATSERFIIIPILFIGAYLAYGMIMISNVLDSIMTRIINKKYAFSAAIFILYPGVLFFTNFNKLAPLREDLTAERFGIDVLNTVEDNGVIILHSDSPIFNTEYVYLTSGGKAGNRNIKLLMTPLIGQTHYEKILEKYFPELLTDKSPEQKTDQRKFILHTGEKFPVYSDIAFSISDEFDWVPYGFLFRLTKKSEIENLDIESYIAKNINLFSKYQNPKQGIMNTHNLVFITHLGTYYSGGRRDVGRFLLQKGQYAIAETYFRESIEFNDRDKATWNFLIKARLVQNKCPETKSNLDESQIKFPDDAEILQLYSYYYQFCEINDQKSEEYLKLYEEKTKQTKTKLDS